MPNIYSKTCVACSAELGPDDWVCPKCGGLKFVLSFNQPMTISHGGTVEIPVITNDYSKTTVSTEGDVSVSFEGELNKYEFAEINERRETPTHFVVIRSKANPTQGSYIDVLFGKKPGGEHSHSGYKVHPRTLFHQDRIGTTTKGKHAYDKNDGAFVPIEWAVEDKSLGVSVTMKFKLDPTSFKIVLVDAKLQ
jgi:hypothetical protein